MITFKSQSVPGTGFHIIIRIIKKLIYFPSFTSYIFPEERIKNLLDSSSGPKGFD
jgi:hypothetical protein